MRQLLFLLGLTAFAVGPPALFIDVTEEAGIRWIQFNGESPERFLVESTTGGVAFIDFDGDGRLDLFFVNYAEFSFNDKRRCDFNGRPAYCAQTEYKGRPPRLYHNQGDGTFRDVTEAAGLLSLAGRALGAVAIDIDGDGWMDLFVARDASPNLLLLNQKDGTFRDAAFEAEVAFNADGVARAGMGVDAGDVDGDGHPDI